MDSSIAPIHHQQLEPQLQQSSHDPTARFMYDHNQYAVIQQQQQQQLNDLPWSPTTHHPPGQLSNDPNQSRMTRQKQREQQDVSGHLFNRYCDTALSCRDRLCPISCYPRLLLTRTAARPPLQLQLLLDTRFPNRLRKNASSPTSSFTSLYPSSTRDVI